MAVHPRHWMQGLSSVCLILLSALCCVLFFAGDDSYITETPVIATERRNKSGLPVSLPHSGSCTCRPGSVMLKDFIPWKNYKELEQRRSQEYKKYKLRNHPVKSKLLYALPNIPMQYPIQGFIVQPLTPSQIPGLALYAEERRRYQVSLKVTIGTLTIEASRAGVSVTGSGTTDLTIDSESLVSINFMLAYVIYTSSIYHVNTEDFVTFQFENHEVEFPISIKQPQVPILWDMGTDINSQVTVTTKTFMRYPKLKKLLDSIRQFYPEIPVIVADDSMEKESIFEEHIEHYLMPPGKGWFAGRNLVVSQVTTKYFLWVDDDFLFTEQTKIEKFLEVMEANPQLDLVGGSVQGHRYYFSIQYEEGEEMEGGCLHMKAGKMFQSLPGYPHCAMVNGVTNFFLARTDAIRKVRFDPKFQKVGHPELFMDGLGSLMVATCNDPDSMYIDHQPQTGNGPSYNKFRYTKTGKIDYRYPIYYFKNYLKCIKLI